MLRLRHSHFVPVSRRCARQAVLAVALVLLSTLATWANDGNDDRAIRLLKTIPVPVTKDNTTAGALYSFDISWVDQERQLYFLADRSNRVVDVVDAKTGTFLKQIAPTPPHNPFAGFTPCSPADDHGPNDCSGPNGVTTAEAPFPWLFVTDAPSRLLCINFITGQTISEVKTSNTEITRADELAYDPTDGLILAINNAATPPFGTFVRVDKQTCDLTVLNTVVLDAAHGVDAQGGAEQPVWEPDTGRFYLSIPQIGSTTQAGEWSASRRTTRWSRRPIQCSSAARPASP